MAKIEPIVGRYIWVPFEGTEYRIYYEEAGQGIPMVITELTDAIVTLDANHPLAGETLHFALTLVEIAA